MLPGKDGFTVMSEMRQAGQFVPTLMLTARGHPDDVLQGFAAGADDYLTKPFDLAILIARISGLLRRRDWLRASMDHDAPITPLRPPSADLSDVFTFGDKSVDFDLLELRVREQVFPLTLMEANVLRYLIQHEGKPVSRKKMLEDVWGLHEDTDTRAIDNFIVRLRRYIEDDPTHPRHLLTVRGVGYRFVALPAKRRSDMLEAHNATSPGGSFPCREVFDYLAAVRPCARTRLRSFRADRNVVSGRERQRRRRQAAAGRCREAGAHGRSGEISGKDRQEGSLDAGGNFAGRLCSTVSVLIDGKVADTKHKVKPGSDGGTIDFDLSKPKSKA